MTRLRSRSRLLAAALVPLVVGLTACSGGGKGDGTPDDVLSIAKQTLDATSGVHLLLETPEMPKGVSGVTKAEGIATHQPAFEGSIEIVYAGFRGKIPVTAVGGAVYAVLPFDPRTKYSEIDPKDYNAPDPAALMDPTGGISSWLTKATDVQKGDQVRDGADILTSYDGRLEGAAVVSAIPSADDTAQFKATFTIDEDGTLRTASVTGPFYKGKAELTYNVTLTEYGTEKDITKP